MNLVTGNNFAAGSVISARVVYEEVLSTLDEFIKVALMADMTALKNWNPSVETVAKGIRMLAHVMAAISDGEFTDENMVCNATQCGIELNNLAEALSSDDEEGVRRHLSNLKMHTRAP